MSGKLPRELGQIRRRLILTGMAPASTLEEVLDGLEVVVSAVSGVLEMVMGSGAVRATLARAATLAARKDPRLERLLVPGSGLELQRLREMLKQESPKGAREAAIALLDEWFYLLHWLLGSVLPALLREAETELAAKDPPPGGGGEGL